MTTREQALEARRPVPVDPGAVRSAGLGAGLDLVGITSAAVLEPARSLLTVRRARGLNGPMAFTYRSPERSTDPAQLLPGARSIVVAALGYDSADPPRPPGPQGRVARYARRDVYRRLGQGLQAMAEVLTANRWRARVVADANDLVDRNAAWRAGLGWYGKNANLLVPGRGSWFVLGSVVTDADLGPVDRPLDDGCGPCTACLDGCPTGALVAPGVLDARRCIAWLVQAAEPIPVELRPAVGDRLYGCDICQEVCPENRRPPSGPQPEPGQESGPVARDPAAWAEVAEVLEAGDEELLERFGRWYIADRDPDVIRRTALVVLGNTAEPGDAQAAALIERYLGHRNPLLRAHAGWAGRRLGLPGVAERLAADPDPAVRSEGRALVLARGTLR